MNTSIYKFNGSEISVDQFPSIALDLYKTADHIAPNRAINTFGMARAHVLLNDHHAAVSLFQQLSYQMTSSNNHDDSFLRQLNIYLDKYNSAVNCNISFILITFLLFSLSDLNNKMK